MNLQRGGLILGLIIGLLIGLALALGVALWVTKAPVPFVNKVPPRTAEQDAAEAERNKNWDPNAPLAGKPASVPAPASAPREGPSPAPMGGPILAPAPAPMSPASAAGKPARDPAAILAGAPVPGPAASTTDAGKSAKAAAGVDPFVYFVQAGAFQNSDEAEQRRAKVGLLGLESKLVEREQSGRTVFRVRIGPFDKQADADAAKDKLIAGGIEAVLVRVDRAPR